MLCYRLLTPVLTIFAIFGGVTGCAPGAEPQTLDSKGVKISYFIEGKGTPVVLLHGLYSSAKINWELPGITALLSKDFQVISLDMRGHGASDKPTGADDYGVEMVEDVVRLMDHLKIKKAHIVGYSMGGIVAVKLHRQDTIQGRTA